MEASFTKANKYLFDSKAWSWNLPSGTTCPGALKCLAAANRNTGKVINGPHQEFKCYSATYERYPSVRDRVWANFDSVRGKSSVEVSSLLGRIFPKTDLVRIHSGGDFFSQDYFDGWLRFVESMPDVLFWAFTKSLPFWLCRLDSIPGNLVLQASYGGKHDALIGEYGLKYAKVVYSVEESVELGLEIDWDDRLAAYGTDSFALLEKKVAGRLKRSGLI
tara:strand:- start:56 stop:712 length:657 start_codon:yes stop_codon:yes gene_type:complete